MDRSTEGLPVHHQLPELAQTHVHRVSDAIQPSHPLSSTSPPAFNLSQHQGLFQWVSSLHWWPKCWSFSFSISLSNEYSGLIFFRIDWLDLLDVPGTLKSLLQLSPSLWNYVKFTCPGLEGMFCDVLFSLHGPSGFGGRAYLKWAWATLFLRLWWQPPPWWETGLVSEGLKPDSCAARTSPWEKAGREEVSSGSSCSTNLIPPPIMFCKTKYLPLIRWKYNWLYSHIIYSWTIFLNQNNKTMVIKL